MTATSATSGLRVNQEWTARVGFQRPVHLLLVHNDEGATSDAMEIRTTEPLAQALESAIHTGDVEALRQLLDGDPLISKARIVDPKGASRTLLHVAAD